MSKEAMKLALEALMHEMKYVLCCINLDIVPFDGDDFHEALRLGEEALAKQEQGEPEAYLVTGPYEKQPFANINSAKAYREGLNKGFGEDAYTISNLYTTPQQRKPLTDEQRRKGFCDQDAQWTFKGMTAWQVWQKAIAWHDAAHGIKE